MEKFCYKCGLLKSCFKKHSRKCHDCVKKHNLDNYYKNKDKEILRNKHWKKNNRDKINKRRKEYFNENREKILERNKKYKKYLRYNLTQEQYENMISKCDNLCAICKRDMEKINIDHNHKTGKVRGLLCRNCNSGLGFFKESLETMKNAINYIKKHNGVESSVDIHKTGLCSGLI